MSKSTTTEKVEQVLLQGLEDFTSVFSKEDFQDRVTSFPEQPSWMSNEDIMKFTMDLDQNWKQRTEL